MQESRLQSDVFFRALVRFIIFVLFSAPIFHCLKLLRFGSEPGMFYFYITFVTLSVLSGLSFLIGRKNQSSINFDPLGLLLIVLFCFALGMTFWFGGEISDIGGNVLRLGFAFSLYQITKKYRWYFDQSRTYQLSLWAIRGVVIAIILLYLLGVFGPMEVYLGLSSQGALLMLSYVLIFAKDYKLLKAILISTLVLMGGKRGIFISAVGVIVFYALIYSKNKIRNLWIFVSSTTIPVLFFSLATLFREEFLHLLPHALETRIGPLLPSKDFNWDVLTSGRLDEVFSVFDEWIRNPIQIFSGKGLGATFEYMNGSQMSTVHITPIALVFIFGLPLAMTFFTLLTYMIIRETQFSQKDPLKQVWVLNVVGALLNCLTLFTIFQDPIIWIGLGLFSQKMSLKISSINRNYRKKTISNPSGPRTDIGQE